MVTVKQFEAPQGTEIMGIGIMGVFENLQQSSIAPILDKYGLSKDKIETDAWYPLQVYFDLYRELSSYAGSTSNLVAIGKAIAQNVTDTDKIDGIEEFITVELNRAATQVIRNTPQGYGYTITKIGENHYQITNNTGSANDIVYGYIWESIRLLANDEDFSFAPIKNYPSDEWGATFKVQW